MLVVPAIDIRGGRCVRLVQGDYARETVFDDDVEAAAIRWIGQGARALHLVDLDGARDGTSGNRDAVERILAAVATARNETIEAGAPGAVQTELGGGIRDADSAAAWLDAGVDRVVLGTVAVQRPEVVSEASVRFPGRIWVGIDARAGKVAVSGWTVGTDRDAAELARDMEARGAAGIIYTDIERDGTGGGVNVEETARIADQVGIPVFASGGVRSPADITRLRAVEARGVSGVIVGRALYDGTITLGELLEAAS